MINKSWKIYISFELLKLVKVGLKIRNIYQLAKVTSLGIFQKQNFGVYNKKFIHVKTAIVKYIQCVIWMNKKC